MKSRIVLMLLLTVLFFGVSCKYEEGPGISFRAKRDRVSNEWIFTKASINGVDTMNYYKRTFSDGSVRHAVLVIMRTGFFNLSVCDGDKKPIYNEFPFGNGILGIGKFPTLGGKWSFDSRHKNIFMNAENSEPGGTTNEQVTGWEIIKLKQNALHIKGKDSKGNVYDYEFAPMNGEDFAL